MRNGSEMPVHCNWISGKNVRRTLTRPSMRLLELGDLIINEVEASWIGYRSQGVQPVFVGKADPMHQELIKVQREIFNRVMENLKPGVTVKELAELTLKTGESRRAEIWSGGGRARRFEYARPRRRRRRPDYHRARQKPAPARDRAAGKYGVYLQALRHLCRRSIDQHLGRHRGDHNKRRQTTRQTAP